MAIFLSLSSNFGGNPATIIRMRFDAPVIEKLIETAWWDWPVERISDRLAALETGNLEGLLAG